MGDGDLTVIAHFLNRGHSLEEMAGLTPAQLLFYRAAWALELDQWKEAGSDGQ